MSKKNIASRYKGEQGEQYSLYRSQDELSHYGYHLQAKFFLPYLSREMRVLDFGCGNGSMAKMIEPHVKEIEGLEVNDLPRSLAQDKHRLTVHATLAEISSDNKYDAIISNHVLEHVPCVVDILRELSTLLVPGGRLIIVLPIDDFRASENRQWQGEDINHHLHTWTPRLFANTLFESSLTPQELRVVTSAWHHKTFFLGDGVLQAVFGRIFSTLKRRRQLFVYAQKAEISIAKSQ
jgi:2-polyprenyl-3-methyl-5-hydroxy-6-metoxy-1,4-benzoquinol methylase